MINTILGIVALVFFSQSGAVSAQQLPIAQDRVELPRLISEEGQTEQSLGIKTTANSVLVVDAQTDKILYAKNINRQQPVASITKLMTVLVFLDYNPGWDVEIDYSEEDQREGSQELFYTWEKVSVKDLFHAGLMMSNNSSIAALVRSAGLTEEEFVNLMNQKAEELGLSNTHFTGITGYNEGNVSTAVDVVKLAREAFSDDDIQRTTSSGRYLVQISNTGRSFFVYNTNQLLGGMLDKGEYDIVAGKTGHINASGYCLVTQVKKEDGGEVISVVLGSDTLEGRFQETKGIVNWVFEHYQWF